MRLIAGVDIGNSTTEACIGRIHDNGRLEFLASSLVETTGAKGTVDNVTGILQAVETALHKTDSVLRDLETIRINEAAPVIGDTAMETITETIITESALIGHDPRTPGGYGIATGETIGISSLEGADRERDYIVVVPGHTGYEETAKRINRFVEAGINIRGVILQLDEGVLVSNRLTKLLPIVDEVLHINLVPIGQPAAVEVAGLGQTIRTLSNPYGIASIFGLSPEETRCIVPVAKSLIGTRSAVVIRTPSGDVRERVIPAGKLMFLGDGRQAEVDVDEGAEEIMKVLSELGSLTDVEGQSGTNIGGMIRSVKDTMGRLTGKTIEEIKIRDFLAVDTMLPVKVQGGLAGEVTMEKAVAVAAMVKTDRLPMQCIAEELQRQAGVEVKIAGVEAMMATLGAMTTPGTELPLAILDLGGGSTDAAVLDKNGEIRYTHLAGAGELVTMLINLELGLNNRSLAEEIKKYPSAKVEGLYQVRLESGEVRFFDEQLPAECYGRTVILTEHGLVPIEKDISIERIAMVRREAKRRIFLQNSIRALKHIAPMGLVGNIPSIVLVGGSAIDFEIPEMLLSELSRFKVVCGRGNIRSQEGPRNAVATGLVMSCVQ